MGIVGGGARASDQTIPLRCSELVSCVSLMKSRVCLLGIKVAESR